MALGVAAVPVQSAEARTHECGCGVAHERRWWRWTCTWATVEMDMLEVCTCGARHVVSAAAAAVLIQYLHQRSLGHIAILYSHSVLHQRSWCHTPILYSHSVLHSMRQLPRVCVGAGRGESTDTYTSARGHGTRAGHVHGAAHTVCPHTPACWDTAHRRQDVPDPMGSAALDLDCVIACHRRVRARTRPEAGRGAICAAALSAHVCRWRLTGVWPLWRLAACLALLLRGGMPLQARGPQTPTTM